MFTGTAHVPPPNTHITHFMVHLNVQESQIQLCFVCLALDIYDNYDEIVTGFSSVKVELSKIPLRLELKRSKSPNMASAGEDKFMLACRRFVDKT